MDDHNRVFLPLKSNIGWFQSLDLRDDISNRIKESILLYDELYIEDGTYQAEIVEGYSDPVEFYNPPGFIPPEQRTIEYERDLKPSSIVIGIGPDGAVAPSAIVLQGNTSTRFKIDYYEIFKNIELLDYNFLKFIVLQNEHEIPRNAREIIDHDSRKDKSAFEDMHPNEAIRNLVIDNLNHDLVASILLKSSVIVDKMHHDLLKRKCWQEEITIGSKPVVESIALREILNIEAPNFSKLPIEKVLELRDERSWSNFRDFIGHVSSTVKEDPEILTNSEYTGKIIKYYAREISKELEKKHTTKFKLGVELGLNATSLIPVYGAIPTFVSAVKSFRSHWDDKSTWYAFILKLKNVK